MTPTPIKPLNVFVYLVAGLVLVAFVAGTAAYLLAGQEAAATAGKWSLLVGPVLGALYGSTRRFA